MKSFVLILSLIVVFASGINLQAEETNTTALASPAITDTNAIAQSLGESAAHPDDNSTLTPGDKIIYQVKEDPAKSSTPYELIVNARGDISFPITLDSPERLSVNVVDKTLGKIREEIKAKLDAEYYKNATVELRLKDQTQRLGKVYLFGAGLPRTTYVSLSPGVPTTILEAVTQAAPNEFVQLKKIKLIRVNPITKKKETRIIDLKDVQKGDKSKDIPLMDGDSIEVPEKTIVF